MPRDALAIRVSFWFAVAMPVPFHLTHDSAAKAERSVSVSTREKLGEYTQEKKSPENPTGNHRHISARRSSSSGYLELRAEYPTNLVTVHRTRQNLPLSSEKRLSTAN
jgi:hypothetical protein